MPIDVVHFTSSDPDEAHDVLDQIYGLDQPMAHARGPAEFLFDVRLITAGEVGADRLRHTTSAQAAMHAPDLFVASTSVHGVVDFIDPHAVLTLGPGAVGRWPTGEGEGYAVWHDVDVMMLRIPMDAIRRVAVEQYGERADDFAFLGLAPASDAAAHRWQTLTFYVHREMACLDGWSGWDAGFRHPIVQQQLADLLASTALEVFPNNAAVLAHQPDPGWAGPRSVRRALEFIAANLGGPITAEDIAAAAGAAPRALASAFHRKYDTDVMGYLRRLRLEAVHDALSEAEPGSTTVAAVAQRWGFGDADAFRTGYLQRFGLSPNQTLAQRD